MEITIVNDDNDTEKREKNGDVREDRTRKRKENDDDNGEQESERSLRVIHEFGWVCLTRWHGNSKSGSTKAQVWKGKVLTLANGRGKRRGGKVRARRRKCERVSFKSEDLVRGRAGTTT